MSTIVEKIKDIEKEISRTQINKATMSHLCTLRAKLAKYRTELLTPDKAGAGKGEGFDVEKVGDARVALIGFPSVGKSTILSTFTTSKSESAAYEFTTLTCIPGIINYKAAAGRCLPSRAHAISFYSSSTPEAARPSVNGNYWSMSWRWLGCD